MADMGLTRNLCKRPRSPEHSSIGQDYAPRDEVVTGQDLRAGKFAKNVDEEEVVSEDPYGTNEPEEAEESQNGVEQPTDGPEDSHAQQPTDVPEGSEVHQPTDAPEAPGCDTPAKALHLQTGAVVSLTGLVGAAHLNGCRGTCERWDESVGRWHVRLPDGKIKALKPDNLVPLETPGKRVAPEDPAEGKLPRAGPPQQKREGVRPPPPAPPGSEQRLDGDLRPGAAVNIFGLSSAAHLNGQTGFCERWDSVANRWHVRLPGGDVKALKPQNLQMLYQEAPEQKPRRTRDNAGRGAPLPPPPPPPPAEADEPYQTMNSSWATAGMSPWSYQMMWNPAVSAWAAAAAMPAFAAAYGASVTRAQKQAGPFLANLLKLQKSKKGDGKSKKKKKKSNKNCSSGSEAAETPYNMNGVEEPEYHPGAKPKGQAKKKTIACIWWPGWEACSSACCCISSSSGSG